MVELLGVAEDDESVCTLALVVTVAKEVGKPRKVERCVEEEGSITRVMVRVIGPVRVKAPSSSVAVVDVVS